MIFPRRSLIVLAAAACLTIAAFDATAVAAGTTAWAPIAVSGPTNLPPRQSEVQRIGVDAEGGTFRLTFSGQTTAAIAFDADGSEVETKLDALSTLGGGGVSIVGGPGGRDGDHPYFVTFDGVGLANVDVAEMTADSSGLNGGGNHTASVTTVVRGGPGTTEIAAFAQNVGGATSTGPITVEVVLPPGVETAATPFVTDGACSSGAGQFVVTCSLTPPGGVEPGLPTRPVQVPIRTDSAAAGETSVQVRVQGGGAFGVSEFEMPLVINALPAAAGIQAFVGGAYDENGVRDARAGAHPYGASTAIFANTSRDASGRVFPSGEFKDILADLPPGFLGNPVAVPQCPDSVSVDECSLDAGVGTVRVPYFVFPNSAQTSLVYNTEAPFGAPAKAKFLTGTPFKILINVVGELRSDDDYGVTFGSRNTPQIVPIFGVFFNFWGSPASSAHDSQRCRRLLDHFGCAASTSDDVAFATNPTDCALEAASPPVLVLRTNTWSVPDPFAHSSVTLPAVTGCDELDFEANLGFQPSAAASADSPAAFSTELTTPSEGLVEPSQRANPELRKTVVKLPSGVVLSPSAADGLGACSEEQIGLRHPQSPATAFPAPNPIRFSKASAECPDASKIGTVDVKSALLAETLHGALYLARQDENPFGSLFAVYLVIDSPERGILVKLPGKVDVDAATGQLTATFDDSPQLPFESLKLNFKGGSRAPMATPATCGTATTRTEMTPWSAPESGPPLLVTDSFDVASGPNGTPCVSTPAQRPFQLGFQAGSAKAAAGAFSPFAFQISRADGNQEIAALHLTTPKGFTAVLKGVPYCGEAAIAAAEASSGRDEQANPACPSASRVGTTSVGSGSGVTPFYTPGKLYLAGPYKGAPLSVVAITPAVAGPFDLGNVVVRSALHVDPETAQITAETDPIPQFLKGVATRVRDIRINLDRDRWALNPTNCNPGSVSLLADGNSGARYSVSRHFQVSGCAGLGFRPKLTASLRGGTKRNDNPAFVSTLTYPQGAYANIASASVTLPHSEFLDNEHIRTICTRVQFAAGACPAGSIYGHAEAITPLLDQPLTGPVYLRSSDNKLPDLVVALRGPVSQPIEVVLDGRIDSVNGGIRTTFEAVPDAPVSRFVLRMQGGRKGLLVNSRNLCTAGGGRMTVRLIGQNGKRHDQFPPLRNQCGEKHHGKGRHGRRIASVLSAIW